MFKKLTMMIIFLSLISLISLTSCSNNTAGGVDPEGLSLSSLNGMPDEVQSAPETVQQAYRYAASNPETLKQIPCYCGCGSMGHTSNYSCYIKNESADGSLEYDSHALGCSICVDITQDVMRLQSEGKSTAEMRAYIDGNYAQYGPSNIP